MKKKKILVPAHKEWLNGSTTRSQELDLSLCTTLLLTRNPGTWNLFQAVDGPLGISQALPQGSEGLLPTTSCWPGEAAGTAGKG